MNEMINFLSGYFIMDRRKTRLYFNNITQINGQPYYYDIIVLVEDFIGLFEVPIKLAMENGTDIMAEIRTFDPENKKGYNNLII